MIKSDIIRITMRTFVCLAIAGCTGTGHVRFVEETDYKYLSPVALAADSNGNILYIAGATANRVAVFDIESGTVRKNFFLQDKPNGLAISHDNARLYITAGSYSGKVHVIDLNSGKHDGIISVGHTPMSPVISPDGRTLYVCNRFDDNVSVIDLVKEKEIAKIKVKREPVAAAVTPDGKYLFVANHLPFTTSYASYGPIIDYSYSSEYAASAVSVIETAENRQLSIIPLPGGATGLRGICLSPDGKYVYVTHILARYQLPTTQLERGWINTNALSIIDIDKLNYFNTVLLDDIDLGAANPWGVTCSPDGKYICVTHAGTHEVSVIDRIALHKKLEEVLSRGKVFDTFSPAADVPDDLGFLTGLRRRVQLMGNGPRGLTITGEKVYVAEYFSDTLGVIDLNPGTDYNPQSLVLGPEQPISVERRGEMYFNDAKLCFQQWQSCASCHPDGRTDALNWDLLNDGLGNPKNTKNLLLSHMTPPAMVTGIRPDAETAVRSGIKHILFGEHTEGNAVAIDTYLKSMKPDPSPYLVKGRLNKSAKRGRKIFIKAGCAECHPAPLYTDMKMYDVGTGTESEKGRLFDTPTLVEVWRTAPYLYDGRAATMRDVLRRHNIRDAHGNTSKLSDKDIKYLTEFVLSL